MASKLIHLRRSAFDAQFGRCYYCKCLMWETDIESFAKANGLTLAQAKRLQSTAEHLRPRKDGGKDEANNIVAACLNCNQRRHKRKKPYGPKTLQMVARDRVSKGCWHGFSVFSLLQQAASSV